MFIVCEFLPFKVFISMTFHNSSNNLLGRVIPANLFLTFLPFDVLIKDLRESRA